MTGYLLLNKPKGITSFQCIREIKKILFKELDNKKIKIGHAGTLDPFATGLLIVCIGREATKSISNMMNLDKEYRVKAKLGELTDTLDLTGEVIEKSNKQLPSKEELEQAIKSFGKTYVQTPPIYSALKYNGKPLYKLAREKKLDQDELEKIIEKKRRTVSLYNIEILDYSPPFFTFKAHVSKGTYIRSLANDIAQTASSIATTYELQRTKIGDMSIKEAVNLEKLKTIDDILSFLKKVSVSV